MENKHIISLREIVSKILKEHVSQKEILNEASIGGSLQNLLKKLESSYGDDVADFFRAALTKSGKNVLYDAKGNVFLRSLSGTDVPISQIERAIDAGLSTEDIVNSLPRKLKDGTDFRSVVVSKINSKKSSHVPNVPKTINVEDFVTTQYPNIRNNSSIYNALLHDAERELSGKPVEQQLSILKQKCQIIHSSLQSGISEAGQSGNPKLADKLREMDRSVSVISKWLKTLGPLKFDKNGEFSPLKSLPKGIAWLFGVAVIADAVSEYSESDGDLYEYMIKYFIKKGKRGLQIIYFTVANKDLPPAGGNVTNNKKPRPY